MLSVIRKRKRFLLTVFFSFTCVLYHPPNIFIRNKPVLVYVFSLSLLFSLVHAHHFHTYQTGFRLAPTLSLCCVSTRPTFSLYIPNWFLIKYRAAHNFLFLVGLCQPELFVLKESFVFVRKKILPCV